MAAAASEKSKRARTMARAWLPWCNYKKPRPKIDGPYLSIWLELIAILCLSLSFSYSTIYRAHNNFFLSRFFRTTGMRKKKKKDLEVR